MKGYKMIEGIVGVNPEILQKNKAYFESIEKDPHPLRSKKFNARMIREGGGEEAEFDEILRNFRIAFRENRSFLEYRQMQDTVMPFAEDTSGIASKDLLYMLSDDPAIFVMEQDLADLLRETDLRGAEFEMLKLPFRTVYFQLPPSPFKVWYPGEEGNLEGAYVTEDKFEGRSWFIFLLVGRKAERRDPSDDCLFSCPVPFEAGPLEDQVIRRIEEVKTRQHSADDNRNADQFPEVFRWILNCLLYINSEGADVQRGWFNEKAAATMKKAKGNKKRAIRHELEKTSTEVSWVGRTVKIQKVREIGEETRESAAERKTPRLHRVRGFWRWQVCGEGRTGRKHIWVRPYLRGEGRDVLGKMYEVK